MKRKPVKRDVTLYYIDSLKAGFHLKDLVSYDTHDRHADQSVRVHESVFGIQVSPEKRWSPFCQRLFEKEKANGIAFNNSSFGQWDGQLDFLKDVSGCERLCLQYGRSVNLSPLEGNSELRDVRLYPYYAKDPGKMDLSTLPHLTRCTVPLNPEFASVLQCTKLVSLQLSGGSHNGVLSLETLPALEEFICAQVSKIRGVVFHPAVRLRALQLAQLKLFASVNPMSAITDELRVVMLNGKQLMGIDWLKKAQKVQSLSLYVGKIPSVNFLKALPDLKLLCLFGSTIEDKDLSILKGLAGEVGPEPWSKL